MTRIATYPGTFDPVTFGHVDVVERAAELFDSVVVTVAINPSKKPLFAAEERVRFLSDALSRFENVRVDSFEGLTVDHARSVGAVAVIRGLRAVTDFEYEFQMALMNRKLAEEINTVFLMPNEKYTYLNSSMARTLAQFGAPIDEFVPAAAAKALREKFGKPNG